VLAFAEEHIGERRLSDLASVHLELRSRGRRY
jgi:hypothetical protein